MIYKPYIYHKLLVNIQKTREKEKKNTYLVPEQRISRCLGPFMCVVYLGPLFGPVFVVGGGGRVLMGGGCGCVLMGDGRGRVLISGGGGCVLTGCVTVSPCY